MDQFLYFSYIGSVHKWRHHKFGVFSRERFCSIFVAAQPLPPTKKKLYYMRNKGTGPNINIYCQWLLYMRNKGTGPNINIYCQWLLNMRNKGTGPNINIYCQWLLYMKNEGTGPNINAKLISIGIISLYKKIPKVRTKYVTSWFICL